MQKDSAVLLEVSVDGSQLTLLDGRKLTVNAGDSRKARGWLPIDMLELITRNEGSLLVRNAEDGDEIGAAWAIDSSD